MRIIIVGAGLVGTQLARYLIQEKHEVSLIESREEAARHASNRLDCLVIHNEGNRFSALQEAGIAKADALVCVTDSDEVNMIICGLAASHYPKLLKIARVRNDEYARLNPSEQASLKAAIIPGGILGIDHFVHPDVEAAQSVLHAVDHGVLGDVLEFSGTAYELGSLDIIPGSSLDGLSLKDFHGLVKGESLITLVERNAESIIPTGATVLAKEDRIHVLAKEEELNRIFTLAGRSRKPLKNIGIIGGGRLGVLVTEGLLRREDEKAGIIFTLFKKLGLRRKYHISIIEKDYRICKELAAQFPKTLILNEDISDESFVAEERINDLDLIITTTDNQELNIITSIYLKSRGVDRAIALVASPGYAAIARRLGVDVVIPMKSVVVDSILSHLMGQKVKGVHRIGGEDSINILEIELVTGLPFLGKTIAEFKVPGEGLVLLVKRGADSFIPRGDYIFTAHDRIVLAVKNGNEREIERCFGSFHGH